MKKNAYGFAFNAGLEACQSGVVFEDNIDKALRLIKKDIKNEYKDENKAAYYMALQSLDVFDLGYSI